MKKVDYLEAILSSVNEVTGSALSSSDVGEKSSVFDLGIDSLNVVELLICLEGKLDISIPFEDLREDTFRSLSDLASFVESQQRARSDACPMAFVE